MNTLVAGIAIAASIAATGVQAGVAQAAPAACVTAAVFKTEIQWGGNAAPWHPDADLKLVLKNRHTIVDRTTAPAGTKLAWSGPNGAGTIAFSAAGGFTGTAQFPNEGPVGYRGVLDRRAPLTCERAATTRTEIQWGGNNAPWHADADLVALIRNRHTVLDSGTRTAGTKASWSGPNGAADITFTTGGRFGGTAQFPNEGPVGYRSAL